MAEVQTEEFDVFSEQIDDLPSDFHQTTSGTYRARVIRAALLEKVTDEKIWNGLSLGVQLQTPEKPENEGCVGDFVNGLFTLKLEPNTIPRSIRDNIRASLRNLFTAGGITAITEESAKGLEGTEITVVVRFNKKRGEAEVDRILPAEALVI